MNRGREQALLFLRKAANDEGLLDEVIHSATVSDDVFAFGTIAVRQIGIEERRGGAVQ